MTAYLQFETLNEIGKRENLEDYICFRQLSQTSCLFIVCDGVGGSLKGEIASKLACTCIADYLVNSKEDEITEADIQNAINYAIKRFDKYVSENPDSVGMATTLTLLYIQNTSALIAHIGDSRVYHLRNSQIIFKTYDHSFVNDLIKSGYITEEEGKTHPKRNVITRAIQNSASDAMADIKVIKEIQKEDYFILCTDGILEGISEEYLAQLCHNESQLQDIRKVIYESCLAKAHDNFSAIIIKVIDTLDSVHAATNNNNNKIETKGFRTDKKRSPNSSRRKIAAIIATAFVLACFGIYFFASKSEQAKNLHQNVSKLVSDSTTVNSGQKIKAPAKSSSPSLNDTVRRPIDSGHLASNTYRKKDTTFYANGDKYIGALKPGGEKTGYGVYLAAKGSYITYCPTGSTMYKGEWKHNKKNGNGECYDSTGRLIYTGIFKDDKPL